MRWLDNITDSVDMDLSKLWEIVKELDTTQRLKNSFFTQFGMNHSA